MVNYDKAGQVETVIYQLLALMLLNEVQKQNADPSAWLQSKPFSRPKCIL